MMVPASVRDYLHEGGIRHAVDELLRLDGGGKVLPGLEWHEFSQYCEALMAAHRLRIDWLMFAQAAFEEIWSGVPLTWRALSPHEQVDLREYVEPTPANCFDLKESRLWFGRVFESGRWMLTACLCAKPARGLRLEIACVDQDERETFRFDDLAEEIEDLGLWSPDVSIVLEGDHVDPSSLREAADRLIKEVVRQTSAGSQKPRAMRRREGSAKR